MVWISTWGSSISQENDYMGYSNRFIGGNVSDCAIATWVRLILLITFIDLGVMHNHLKIHFVC